MYCVNNEMELCLWKGLELQQEMYRVEIDVLTN